MPQNPKLKSLNELAGILDQERAASREVVHCHGVFDLLHIGHIRYLQKAKQLGDLLVVTVTPDRFVNKGPHRPAFEEQLRADAIAAVECVDFVAINEWPTATETIELLKPNVYAKGAEFRDRKTPELLREEAAINSAGGRIELVEEVTSSSSQLLNEYLSPFSDQVEHYLRTFRQSVPASSVTEPLSNLRSLKVLVVGEAIIDEYYSCATLGGSSKAPIVATRYESHDRYVGGALAVANHIAGLCDNVDLLGMLGEIDSHEEWIRGQLRPNVNPQFSLRADAPTIVKRQYRESYFGVPLFEMNTFSPQPLRGDEATELASLLEQRAGNYDLVVVADYGLGMLNAESTRALCQNSKYLAVTTHASAANVGYHTVSRYEQADYFSIAEHELRLECRSRSDEIPTMLQDVSDRLQAGIAAVTIGKQGCICYDGKDLHEAPALATRVVDRTGAGDAFFAITALCAAADVPPSILAFLGNVAAAEAVASVGNSRFLEELPLGRHVESLLK